MAATDCTVMKCPSPMKATSNGVFQGDNPLDFALPLAILQICLVVVLTRLLAFFLRPMRQPRVIAEIIGGVLLGPSALGRSQTYLHKVFPAKSMTVLDTLANMGLLFFMFLVGLELDLTAIRKTGKKTLSIALAGITLPFALGIGTSFVLRGTVSKGVREAPFLVFMGVALSITAFPVLARILAELKLLTTDVGRLAMSAAAVNDVAAWILLALAIALSGGTGHSSPLISLWVFLCGFGFVVTCAVVVPPAFRWMERRCPVGEPMDETYVCGTLVCVLAAGFVTDAIGIHALFGAFIVGVLVPKDDGQFSGALVEKVEDLVSGLFLPLYFVSSGLKTNVATIQGPQSWSLLLLVISTACLGKIFGTMAVSLMFKVPFKEAVALGFLMNTKGLVELIVLNIGRDRGVLNDQTFAIMILMALFTTFITTPIVMAVYKPAAKDLARGEYKHRTIQRKDMNTEMRMLACFHSTRNVPTLINLIEVSRGTEKKEVGLCVYAMHLMELSERSSAILMVQKARKKGMPFWNKGLQSDSSHVSVAFEAFRHLSGVLINPTVAIAPMNTMHEDICASAARKRVAIIILPFHKQQGRDGQLEATPRNDLRNVNRRVLEHAPCSVAIFVDRSFGGLTQISASSVDYAVIVLFFGGPDDREALSYGARMAQHPGISTVVIRFMLEPELTTESASDVVLDINELFPTDQDNSAADEEFLNEFKQQQVSSNDSIKYEEMKLSSGAQAVEVIREHGHCNLFLVGRVPEGGLVGSISVRSDCPELGPLGSFLTSDVSIRASVLVVQQYHSPLSQHSLASLKDEDSN